MMKLYVKNRQDSFVLKELLQFIRSTSPGKRFSFSYVETSTSLLPNLSLWENLQLVSGVNEWIDLSSNLNPEYHSLINLITSPELAASKAEDWDKMITSLLKSLISNPEFILIDINEDCFSPLNLQNLKKIINLMSTHRKVLLASANTAFWEDTSQTIITRDGFEFRIVDNSQTKKKVA